MKTTVIFHNADYDGIFCREIARKFLPDAELIGWDFADKPLAWPDADTIYILDLPVDRPFGVAWDKDIHDIRFMKGNVVWIDHHKSAIESHPTTIPGYRIDGVAACRLAWQWFIRGYHNGTSDPAPLYPTKDYYVDRKVVEPLAVRLAGEYDIWDKRDPRAELFQHGLRTVDLDESRWWVWFFEHRNDNCVNDLLERGRTVQFVRDNEYREVITQQGFDVQFEGLTFLACNSHELDIRSHLFAAGIKPHHDALMGFTFNGKDWRISLYHAPGHEQHDLSEIAKKHGGGGHRGACGFRADKLPFIP